MSKAVEDAEEPVGGDANTVDGSDEGFGCDVAQGDGKADGGSRKKSIAGLYEDPTFYQRTLHDEIDRLVKESAALDQEIEKLQVDWEALEAEIAETTAS